MSEEMCSFAPGSPNVSPDTFPDLFAGYAVIWGLLFLGLSMIMARGWKLDRRLKTLEDAHSSVLGKDNSSRPQSMSAT